MVSGEVVLATHETDHRFTVYGVVKSRTGQPRVNVRVMVTHADDGSTVFTDSNGYYEILLHLHNSNLGDEIRIVSEKEVKTIKAVFDPNDKVTERKVAVNFEAVGEKKGFGLETSWNYLAGILFSLGFVFFLIIYFRQRKSGASGN